VDAEKRDQMGMPAASTLALLPRVLTWWLGLPLAVVLSYVFFELAGDVWSGEGFGFDQQVMGALHVLATPRLTATLQVITASASGLLAYGLALGLVLYWRQAGRRAEATVLHITLVGSAVLGQGLKVLFARPRPQFYPWLTGAWGWSFPSGHTLTAVVLGGLLAWLIGRKLKDRRQIVLWAVAALWAGLVGLSRIYLGVHYPSDVLASLAVGGLCLLAARYSYRALDSQSLTLKRK